MAERHKCFISYHKDDKAEVESFIDEYDEAFIDKIVGAFDYEPIASQSEEYIKRKIREDFLTDSTVTLVLIGKCTWARKYVDWEIASTLRDDTNNKRSGLFGITLPSVAQDQTRKCPARLEANRGDTGDDSKYARWYKYPNRSSVLVGWIEDAYQARDVRANTVDNGLPLRTANRTC